MHLHLTVICFELFCTVLVLRRWFIVGYIYLYYEKISRIKNKEIQTMNYKEILLELYEEANKQTLSTLKLPVNVIEHIEKVAQNCFTQKGVYTVFITLAIYKICHPEQDIRNHQTQIKNGFSGRTIDTQHITPTLKELGLPSMAESGWLTRSLEQPYPYTLDYVGKISNKGVKKSFLELIDAIETTYISPSDILVELFRQIIVIQQKNKVTITPIKNPDSLTISKAISLLDSHFSYNYNTFGGSKLPVIAFYAMYEILIKELSRYDNSELKPLGSHTASDRTSKSSGDIEIYKKGVLFESIEIKLDKEINANIVRIAREKIIKYNPSRYYILSYFNVNEEERLDINNIVDDVKNKHGCQIVINGVIPSLKYYMRLITDLQEFFSKYSSLVENDTELKSIHKSKLNELVKGLAK